MIKILGNSGYILKISVDENNFIIIKSSKLMFLSTRLIILINILFYDYFI